MAKENQSIHGGKEGGRQGEWREGMSEERRGENVCPTLTPGDLLAPSRALVFYRGMRLGPLDTISS